MTVGEFKQWLNQFDADKDGRISKAELHEAIRSLGVRFTSWKTRRGLLAADDNNNGVAPNHDQLRGPDQNTSPPSNECE
ncbi:hypothetical protein FRX31_010683 [Thalictrum thalictroides]|uniref:EF-hand domain-containing protein n=1 Tax=Thalictrum thalictroides TaxID=46969 RepID=A0A7J6WRW0_THATH|nr:hypothetical protein FRX31_010683 [Thalictrum thalictroides]